MNQHFDTGSIIVILITFILFVLALFAKDFTHDLLLEAGIFLISAKLIIMAYNNSMASEEKPKHENKTSRQSTGEAFIKSAVRAIGSQVR